jgi:hypothetical protein
MIHCGVQRRAENMDWRDVFDIDYLPICENAKLFIYVMAIFIRSTGP